MKARNKMIEIIFIFSILFFVIFVMAIIQTNDRWDEEDLQTMSQEK